MLGLVDEVEGETPRIRGRVRDQQALRRAAEHVRRRAVALRQHLRRRHGWAPRPDDLADPRECRRPERERRDPGGAVGAEDVLEPKLVGGRQRRRVDRTGPGHRRDEDGDLRHAGHDGRRADLAQDGREAPLAGGHVEPGRRDRGHLLAHEEPRAHLLAPAGRRRPDLRFVEQPAVRDRLTDAAEQRGRHRRMGGGQLVGTDAEVGGGDRDAVEPRGRLHDRGVPALADVREEPLDRRDEAPARRSRRWSGRGGAPAPWRRARPSGERRGCPWRERNGWRNPGWVRASGPSRVALLRQRRLSGHWRRAGRCPPRDTVVMTTTHGATGAAPLPGARPVRAPRGTALSCRGWQQEAVLRMLMNNLDPEVAENPDALVVYGGTGRAARNWEAFDAIVRELRGLADDETLLVQSGKPVGVFRTHPWAPARPDRELEPGGEVGDLGALPRAGAGRPDDVRADDGRLLDLHRDPGDPPGHLRDVRRAGPPALRRDAARASRPDARASAGWAAPSRWR